MSRIVSKLLLAPLVLLIALAVVTTAHAAADPKAMRLRVADLPVGFAVEKERYMPNAVSAKEDGRPVSLLLRWGRINGYEIEFSRTQLVGAAVVSSTLSVYRTPAGAHSSMLDTYARMTKPYKGVTWRRASLGGTRLGHEARMFVATLKQNGTEYALHGIVWRYRNVKVGVLVAGLVLTDSAETVRIGRRQQARIQAVVG